MATKAMMSAAYTTFAGMVVHQRRNGVDTELISDPLGSVVKTKDATGNETSRTEYWPYGEVQSSTGSNPTPFGFVGTLGYYRDLATRLYVRARYLRPDQGRWQTVDPLWPRRRAFLYAIGSPALFNDPSGLDVFGDASNYLGPPNPGIWLAPVGDWFGNIGRGIGDVGRGIGNGLRNVGRGVIKGIGDWFRDNFDNPGSGWPHFTLGWLPDFNYGRYCGAKVGCPAPQPSGIDCTDKACREHDNCTSKLPGIWYAIGDGAKRCHCKLFLDAFICSNGGCHLDHQGGIIGDVKCQLAAIMVAEFFGVECAFTPTLRGF